MAMILQPDTANAGCTFSENMCTCCQAWPDMQSDRKNQLGKKRRAEGWARVPSKRREEWIDREEWDTDRIRCECRNPSESTYLEPWGSVQTLPTTAQSTCRPGAQQLYSCRPLGWSILLCLVELAGQGGTGWDERKRKVVKSTITQTGRGRHHQDGVKKRGWARVSSLM